MTPQGQDKWDANPSTMDNYNIDDLSSGDETDDDERPRKAIPAWAQKNALKSALRRQYKRMEYVIIWELLHIVLLHILLHIELLRTVLLLTVVSAEIVTARKCF